MSTETILRTLGADPDGRFVDLSAATVVEALAIRLGADRPEWMTTEQAERYTSRSADTLGRWAAAGHIEVRRGGGRAGNRYSRSSIDAHLGGSS